MTPVFLDTVGLIALWDKDDQWHDAAEKAYQSIADARRTAITTTFILLECGNAASRRTFRKDVCDLRNALELRHELIEPTNEEWLQAWAAYQRGDAGDARNCRPHFVSCDEAACNRRSLHERQTFRGRRL
jgi:uncharacterized protein